MYDARHERERRQRETPEFILKVIAQRGYFSVSWRHRDDWLRRRCAELTKQKLIRIDRKQSGKGTTVYVAVKAEGSNK